MTIATPPMAIPPTNTNTNMNTKTTHTQPKDRQVPVISNNNTSTKKKKQQKVIPLKTPHEMKQSIVPPTNTIRSKTRSLTTNSPPRNPPKTLEEGLTYVFSTIAELTDDDTAEYIAGMLVEDHSDDDTREFVCRILKEAMPNARAGAVVCDRLFGCVCVVLVSSMGDFVSAHQTYNN